MSYLDPHHVNRKNNLYYQRKGQTIPARLVDPSPLIDRSLVPFYLQYIRDNRLLPLPPEPHFPYDLSLSRIKIFPHSGGDFYPTSFHPISFSQTSDKALATLNFPDGVGWYAGYIYVVMSEPYQFPGFVFYLFKCERSGQVVFPLSVDAQYAFNVTAAYSFELISVFPSSDPPFFMQAEFSIPKLSAVQHAFFILNNISINDGELYLSSFLALSHIASIYKSG